MCNNKIKLLVILILMIFNIVNVNAQSLEPYINPETNYKVVIEDDANLLTEEELNKLQEEMKDLTIYGNIIFKTSYSHDYYSTSSFASNYYHDNFGTTSGTLFLIDMQNREIYIFSDGENYNSVTSAKATIITDNIYKYASQAEYYECASQAFSQINAVLSGAKIAEPMKYISNSLIAVTLAFFISFIYILISTNTKKTTAKEIISGCIVDFNVGNVTGIRVGQHREYSPQSDSSSSGGSSGGGGGGGSSGGGGGHSF